MTRNTLLTRNYKFNFSTFLGALLSVFLRASISSTVTLNFCGVREVEAGVVFAGEFEVPCGAEGGGGGGALGAGVTGLVGGADSPSDTTS